LFVEAKFWGEIGRREQQPVKLFFCEAPALIFRKDRVADWCFARDPGVGG
jgi:hypothetical protein